MKLPIGLLMLDLLGTVLLALGCASLADLHFVPPALRFDGYGIVLIVLGIALTVPFVVTMIRRGQQSKDA